MNPRLCCWHGGVETELLPEKPRAAADPGEGHRTIKRDSPSPGLGPQLTDGIHFMSPVYQRSQEVTVKQNPRGHLGHPSFKMSQKEEKISHTRS